MNRKKEIIKLRNEGLSYGKIGDRFGISRQRIHQILTGYKSPRSCYDKKRYKKERLDVLQFYGGEKPKCNICGFDNVDCLTIDHINNNGANHRKNGESSVNHNIRRWIIKNNYPKGFQVLCRNCNWLKWVNFRREKLSTVCS